MFDVNDYVFATALSAAFTSHHKQGNAVHIWQLQAPCIASLRPAVEFKNSKIAKQRACL